MSQSTDAVPFIYWGSGSSPCWKALIALQEKGVKYDEKIIEFSKKEHKSEEILKLNPRGQVPTFKHGDLIINESNAICMYVEHNWKNNPLIPTEVKAMALCLQRMYETPNLHSKVLEPIWYYKMRTPKEKWDENELKEKYQPANEELARWEGYLSKGNSYIAGNDFTMADIFFFPFIATFIRLGANIEKSYPNLFKYYKFISERPSVKNTSPPHWKTSEGPGTLADLC